MIARKQCYHCHERPITRPRGLCFGCYRTVRDLYGSPDPETARFAQRGPPNFTGPALAGTPTEHFPQTAGKEDALTLRAAAGESLFHPEDARRDLK